MNIQLQSKSFTRDGYAQRHDFGKAQRLLQGGIEAQARRSPLATALEFPNEQINYRELHGRADHVASDLSARGVRPGDFIVVYLRRSPELFVSLLGVLKAGAAYVPVDPRCAPEEVETTLAGRKPRFILTSEHLSRPLAASHSDKLLLIESIEDGPRTLPNGNGLPGDSITARHPSHVNGMPIAAGGLDWVPVTHGEAVSIIRSLISVYGLDAEHRCYQAPSLAFDVALEEAWAMLSAGATLVSGDEDTLRSPEETARFLLKQRITLLSAVPEVLEAIADDLPTVQHLIIGARPCSSALVVNWAFRMRRIVTLKRRNERYPSFCIEQETGIASKPRLLPSRTF